MLALCVLALLAGPAYSRSAIKIIGGEDAEVGQFPYQGSLRTVWYNETRAHYCGCTLVSPKYAVSAAHCTEQPASAYDVQLGLTRRSEPANSQTIQVSQIFNHPSYGSGPGFYPNDISVIVLAEEANLGNELIATIPMAESDDLFDGLPGIMSGWGYTTTGGSGELPDHLQFVEINVFSYAECQTYWGTSVNDGHICVGEINSAGACGGDSGSPVVADGKFIGVASWVRSGCYTTHPSVYSRVAYFREWLDSVMV